jgi:hypothetical protein
MKFGRIARTPVTVALAEAFTAIIRGEDPATALGIKRHRGGQRAGRDHRVTAINIAALLPAVTDGILDNRTLATAEEQLGLTGRQLQDIWRKHGQDAIAYRKILENPAFRKAVLRHPPSSARIRRAMRTSRRIRRA